MAIEHIICEYRTMFEDVASTVPNIRPNDDVLYTSMNYEKILKEMCAFLEGYISYRDKNDHVHDDRIISSTQNFYNAMFSDMSPNSPYRHQITLADMKHVNESFVQETQRLNTIMESIVERYDDFDSQQLMTMSKNQLRKLCKVYSDDSQLYQWLATKGSRVRSINAPVEKRVAFWDLTTPVMHRLDKYPKNS